MTGLTPTDFSRASANSLSQHRKPPRPHIPELRFSAKVSLFYGPRVKGKLRSGWNNSATIWRKPAEWTSFVRIRSASISKRTKIRSGPSAQNTPLFTRDDQASALRQGHEPYSITLGLCSQASL